MPVTLARAARLAADADPRTDAALISSFLASADEPSFAELVRRHGPMVLGVCRRALGNAADADDAFQATFLVLVRRARRVSWRPAVGAWLYGVAVRVARKARAARARRLAIEKQGSAMTPEPAATTPDPDDAAAALDEELAALPDALREPLVLCELQGRTRKDAAAALGLAEGTLSSRLARGRRLLRDRLARRGVVPAALAVAVPPRLAAAAVDGAVLVRGGAVGAVPAAVLALTDGVVKTMVASKLKLAAVAAAVGLGLAGAGAWGGRPAAADDAAKAIAPPAKVAGRVEVEIDVAPPDRPVATIFRDVPVSRAAFAEHLIRRYGEKELQLFVNKQIIARAFARKGWALRAGDVSAALDADAKAAGMTRAEFRRVVVAKSGKSMTQWREDVVEPRLMLARLCGEAISTATDTELRAAFDRRYGEKLMCEVLVWPKDNEQEARAAMAFVDGRVSLDVAHRAVSPRPGEAQNPGRLHRNFCIPRAGCEGGDELNRVVARLRPGEASGLIRARLPYADVGPAGEFAVIRCEAVVAADQTKLFDAEKAALVPEVLQEKITREIPKRFRELCAEANPVFHLRFDAPK